MDPATGDWSMGVAAAPDALRVLAKGLLQNSTLQELDLSGNSIGPDGARRTARALEAD